YGWYFGRQQPGDDKKDESGTYALHTLGEDETIAQLATGIKRFKLPDEFNYIKIYQQIAADPRDHLGQQSLMTLAQIYSNRRQYPKSADYWRQIIARYGHGQQQLAQIVGNWGRFEPIMTQPAGRGAAVDFRFRNGKRLELVAHEIKIEKLLSDLKAY